MSTRLTEQQQRALEATDAQRTTAEAVREVVRDEKRQAAIRKVGLRNAGQRAGEAP